MGNIKKLSLAIALAALAFWAVSSSEPGITNSASINSGIVAFGDSLVQGAGSASGGGFVKMLEEELNISITNLGRSGDTTGDALRRIEEVASMKPAVTLLLLGGNDYLQIVPREETRENLSRIIEKIHASGSAVVLIGLEDEFEDLSELYNTAYVGDILGGIYGAPGMMSDSLHPNDSGYRLMAERIRPVLAPLIKKN